jgi:mRNA interferase MazF
MPIKEHPLIGTILLCDFSAGFREPEMVKRRPVVVISPKIGGRPGLCTVVALSATAPAPVMRYHCQIDIEPALPAPLSSKGLWVKGDMVNAVGLHRLDLIRLEKNFRGKKQYRYDPVSAEQLTEIRRCILMAMGLAGLTKHL